MSDAFLEPVEALPDGRRQVHLVGFMGSGKSTVARLVARHLVWNYLDLDALIERHDGRRIHEIFSADGEAGFRDIEHHVLRQAIQKPRTVVALGGGTPASRRNRGIMQASGVSVWLRCEFPICQARVGVDARRPLFTDPAAARRLFDERQPAYEASDLTVDATAPPDEVAAGVVAALGLG
jgi:shikimate kinase